MKKQKYHKTCKMSCAVTLVIVCKIYNKQIKKCQVTYIIIKIFFVNLTSFILF